MSMPVNNIQSNVLAALPLVLLAVTAAIAIWLLTQGQPFATGQRLAVHQALHNIPAKDSATHLAELTPKDMYTGRDPFFRSPAVQKQALQPLEGNRETAADLQEIFLTTVAEGLQGRYCLINGDIYHEGHIGNGFTVEQVQTDRVTFSTPVQTFTLQPGKKVTLEGGRILIADDKNEKDAVAVKSNETTKDNEALVTSQKAPL